jgi:hypothetical protein
LPVKNSITNIFELFSRVASLFLLENVVDVYYNILLYPVQALPVVCPKWGNFVDGQYLYTTRKIACFPATSFRKEESVPNAPRPTINLSQYLHGDRLVRKISS